MRTWRIIVMAGAASAYALTASNCAGAGRATNQILVSVSPIASCSVTATPLVFFVPTPANATVDSTALLNVKCPPNTAFLIDIDNGLNAQGNNRRVFNAAASAYLNYDIFKDPPKSKVWGKGNLKNVSGDSGPTGAVIYTVYGQLSAKSSMTTGGYQDTLTITVSF
jgi:spore coat protein U-like protein